MRWKRSAVASLVGRHAVVTGAASGIGRATAIELAQRGADLTLLDIDRPALEETADSVRALGRQAKTHEVDMADAQAVEQFAARLLRGRRPVDLLINNAGVAVAAPLARTSAEDWEWIAGVNLWGPVRLTRALLPSMIDRREGHVVMVASLAGLVAAPGMVAYTTTKFAIVGFAEALRLELAGSGVDVTVVCPGYVRTNLARSTRYRNDGFREFLEAPPAWYGMTSERAARVLLDAVSKKRALVTLGPEKIAWWLKRLAPEASFVLTRWVARRTGIDAAACYSFASPRAKIDAT